ncbi:MAG: asparagine synthase-related protein [Duganella sp.]
MNAAWGLCGFYGRLHDGPARAPAAATLQAMGARLSAAAGAPLRTAQSGACGVAVAAPAGSAHVHQRDGLLVAIWGRPLLDGRADDVAARMADAWLRHGPHGCQVLTGAFALAIVDSLSGQVCLAVDRCGALPLFYQPLPHGLAFGSSTSAVLAHPEAGQALDPQALYHYLHFHMVPAPHAAQRQQRRLLPGEFLHYRRGKLVRGSYWSLQFDERQRPPFAELKHTFRATLEASVRHAAADGRIGAFLSGGTDSSTLAGILGQVRDERPRTYAIGFDVPGYDEMRYARIAARHFGTDHHEYYVTAADVVAAIPQIAAACDQPFGNASLVPAYYCARLAAADGVTRLIGGDGGDELFGGNERYARQAVFARYERLPSAVRQVLLEPLLFGAAGALDLAPLRKARSYIEQATTAMPARLDSYNLLRRYGADTVLTAEFLAGVDPSLPQSELHACYWGGMGQSQINRLQALDMRYTLADSDLPKVRQACALAGVDVAFPFLSDAMLAFSASLAPEAKLNGTRLRYFFKQALRDHLPRAIVRKRKHGFGLPFGHWLHTHADLRALAYDSLTDLKARRIVRADFIDTLTGRLVGEHPAYHGTMVWVLMMLEQWLRLQQAQVAGRLVAAGGVRVGNG